MVAKKLKNFVQTCFTGEVTIPKVTFWLTGAVCLLAGIVYGMRTAPFTHGVAIGSNNGNQTNCGWEKREDEKEKENKK